MKSAIFVFCIFASFFTGMGVHHFLAQSRLAELSMKHLSADVDAKICAHRLATIGIPCQTKK